MPTLTELEKLASNLMPPVILNGDPPLDSIAGLNEYAFGKTKEGDCYSNKMSTLAEGLFAYPTVAIALFNGKIDPEELSVFVSNKFRVWVERACEVNKYLLPTQHVRIKLSNEYLDTLVVNHEEAIKRKLETDPRAMEQYNKFKATHRTSKEVEWIFSLFFVRHCARYFINPSNHPLGIQAAYQQVKICVISGWYDALMYKDNAQTIDAFKLIREINPVEVMKNIIGKNYKNLDRRFVDFTDWLKVMRVKSSAGGVYQYNFDDVLELAKVVKSGWKTAPVVVPVNNDTRHPPGFMG
jgi:hypothetical protein